ncbi:MAG: ferritin-like domain-containing protein [Mycobacteriales bacterium]
MTDRDPLQISEAELRAMTKQMNEMHAETFPVLHESLGDFGSSLRGKLRTLAEHSANRRTFLIGSGAALGGVLLAACGKDDPKPAASKSSSAAPSSASSAASSAASGAASPSGSAGGAGKDIAALSTNASLENLAVFAYMSALAEAPKGKFGKSVPPAVAEFAKHAMMQHKDHAAAFNAALKIAGAAEFTKPNPALADTVIKLFGEVKDVPGLAQLALTLENTAGATYVKQMGTLTNPDALKAVATIAPVERQHAAILNFVLGNYPVPDVFVKLDEQSGSSASLGARPDTDAGVS